MRPWTGDGVVLTFCGASESHRIALYRIISHTSTVPAYERIFVGYVWGHLYNIGV